MFKKAKIRSRATKLLAVLCCLSMFVSVFAFFTDRVDRSASGVAGNMDLVFTDISSGKTGANGITSNNEFAIDKVWDASMFVADGGILNPGDYFDLSYELTNGGSKSMDIRQQLTVTSSVPMTDDAEEYTLTIIGGNNATAVEGVLSADKLSITYDLTDIILDGSVETEDGAVDGKYTVQLDFLRTAGNSFMNSSVGVSLKAQAKQHRNTTDADWATWAEYETKFEQIDDGSIKMLYGDGQSFHSLAPSTLTFRSSAELDDFQEVQINGETVDPSNYTLTEGSTVVTLKIDYLKTLDKGNYNLNIVSETGAPNANFKVIIPETNNNGFYYNQPYTAYTAAFGEDLVFFMREGGVIDVIGCSSKSIQTGSYIVDGNNLTINGIYGGPFTGTISSDGTEIFCNELQLTYRLGDVSVAVADEDYIYFYNESLGGYEVKAIDNTKSSYAPIKTGINNKPTVKLADYFTDTNYSLTVAPKIPDSVTTIGNHAFAHSSLESIIIPDSVTTIGNNAFGDCPNLKSIIIPDSVTYIGASAFSGSSLESIIIPDSVTYIGGQACADCLSLDSITFEGTIAQWNAIDKYIGWNRNVPATEVICSNGTVSL